MDPDRVEHIRVGRGENLRHRAARRQARGENALSSDVELLRERLRQPRQLGGLARTAVLMATIEPVPAAVWVGEARLVRIGDDEAELLRKGVHPRANGEIFRVLRATVQHDDQRQLPPLGIGRKIEAIVKRTRRPAIAALQEPFAEIRRGRRLGRLWSAGRNHRPHAQSAQGLAQRTAWG